MKGAVCYFSVDHSSPPDLTEDFQQISVETKSDTFFFLTTPRQHVGLFQPETELEPPVVELLHLDAFELWCWRRLLRVPWTARRSNQSIQKEISPECSLEGLMLKLKLQYFGHLMQRADLFEKTLMLGKIEGRRRRGQQKMRWLDGITDSMDMSLGKFWGVGDGQGGLVCCSPWDRKELDTTEQLN